MSTQEYFDRLKADFINEAYHSHIVSRCIQVVQLEGIDISYAWLMAAVYLAQENRRLMETAVQILSTSITSIVLEDIFIGEK